MRTTCVACWKEQTRKCNTHVLLVAMRRAYCLVYNDDNDPADLIDHKTIISFCAHPLQSTCTLASLPPSQYAFCNFAALGLVPRPHGPKPQSRDRQTGQDAARPHPRSRATRSDGAAPGSTGAAVSGRGTGRGQGKGRSGPKGVAAAVTKRQHSSGKQQGPAKRMQAKGGGQKRPRALALSK